MTESSQVRPASPTNDHILRSLRQAADRIQMLEAGQKQPIAIVGIACRFPGEAYDVGAFWDLLRAGRDAITDVPPDRWPMEAYQEREPGEAGKISSRQGGFLTDIDRFDARFFAISGREAKDMDPQQRIALECAWEAFENAGTDWRALKGSRTGVFMGATTNDYGRLCLSRMGVEDIDAHFATGNALNSIAGRISYTLGLEGPCLTIDTACSSSLAAVHLATRSLRSGECEVALAGGVNLLLMPEASIATSRARMLSPDGRCKTFDRLANGYVRSEGCGVVVLMRASDAVRENRRIYASILGTAVNQNGESSGLTVPSRRAQGSLIRDALADAGLAPGEIDYVEAHGTGTSLGDPIELNGLKDSYGQAERAAPLLVGSVKSNIGHTESAAGIAGLIKATLAIWHGEIPPSLHCHEPTPHFAWDGSGLRVCTSPTAWPHADQRRAAVSSFGASGSNAHVILGGQPSIELRPSAPDGPYLLALSARSAPGLRLMVQRATAYLRDSDHHFPDLCRAVNLRRQWPFRLVVRAESCADAAEALSRHAAGENEPRISSAPAIATDQAQRARVRYLVDSSAGTHGAAIKALYDNHPVFRDALERLDGELGGASPWLGSLRTGVAPSSPPDAAAMFAVTVAEAEFWRSWGLQPDEFVVSEAGLPAAAYLSGAADLGWVRHALAGRWSERSRSHVPIFGLSDAAAMRSGARGLLTDAQASHGKTITLSPGQGTWQAAAAEAFVAGVNLLWAELYPRYEVAPPDFPSSIFERASFWPAERIAPLPAHRSRLVDRYIEIAALGATVVETDLGDTAHAVFREHLVFERIVVAGACHVALMLEAAARRWPGQRLVLSGLQFDRPLILSGDLRPSLQILLESGTDGAKLSAVSFRIDPPGSKRTAHASASIRIDDAPPWVGTPDILADFAALCPDQVSASAFYEQLQRRTQIEHGPVFRWIHSVSVGDLRAIGELRVPAGAVPDAILDPGLIDCCFQLIAAAAGDGADGTFVPFAIGTMSVEPSGLTGALTAIAEIDPTGLGQNTVRGRVRLFGKDAQPVADFDDLQFRRASPELLLRDISSLVDPDLYTLAWSAIVDPPTERHVRDTLVITSDAAFGARIAAALQPSLAGRVETLALGPASPDNALSLSAPDRDLLASHLAAAAGQDRPLRILFLPRIAAQSDDVLVHPEPVLLEITMQAAQARCPVELVIVTTDTLGAPNETAVNVHESGLWGFAAVLHREQPRLGVRVLDVERDAPGEVVVAGIARCEAGDRLLLRDGICFEPSLELSPCGNSELPIRADRSYLVTGAFGGIGRLIVADLVARGACHLVLVGRHSETDEAIAFADSLRHRGIAVLARSIDVADPAAVRALVGEIAETAQPLAGVVHAAAVLDDASILDLDWDRMRRVIAAKSIGAWNLHRETAALDIDVFVMFSSASALLGTPGQAAYAAANASLEGIAGLRRMRGLAASTIAWGPWAGIGMTSQLSAGQRALLSKAGIGLIEPEEGMRAFGQVACRPNTIVIKALSPTAVRAAFARGQSRTTPSSQTSAAGATLARDAARIGEPEDPSETVGATNPPSAR